MNITQTFLGDFVEVFEALASAELKKKDVTLFLPKTEHGFKYDPYYVKKQ